MKIKIMDDFVHEYEDVTLGKVYEVVDDREYFYVVIDDMFDRNRIDKKHCEIVAEENMFNEGDVVRIIGNGGQEIDGYYSVGDLVGQIGRIIEVGSNGDLDHVVEMEDGLTWHIPEKMLQKLPNLTDLEDDEDDDQSLTLQQIIQFTQNNRGFSIEFDAGKITLADWSTDPNATFYRPKTLEELEELMELLEKINEYKYDNE